MQVKNMPKLFLRLVPFPGAAVFPALAGAQEPGLPGTVLPWSPAWGWLLLLALLLLGLGWLGYHWRLRYIERSNRQLEAQISERTHQLTAVNQDLQRVMADRLRAEHALRESEEEYRQLVENINDVIYAMDEDGVISYISPAIEKVLGYRPQEVMGRSFNLFIHQADLDIVWDRFARLVANQSVESGEYRMVAKSGELRWLHVSSQPVLDDGRVTGVRGVLMDVTDRRQSEEQIQYAAAAAERERLARDLHDAVTQSLFSASAIAEALPRVWEHDPEQALQALQELRWLTKGALAEMRALLLELRPAALVDRQLSELLRQLTDGMMGRTRMPVTTTIIEEGDLPEDVKIGLYRIAQEALNNVAKHARASQAWVSLTGQPGQVQLRVADDGCGFDPEMVGADHMGLKIMHERAEAIGARMDLETGPDQGTEIKVLWTDGKQQGGS